MLKRLRHGEDGISLAELLVAGAMASIIATAFITIFFAFSRGVSLEEARAAALNDVQATTADLATELRQAVGLTPDSSAVESLQAAWPAPEITFYSDRADATGPERYRYFVTACSGGLCELHRELTVADAGGPPWTYTTTPVSKRVVANLITGGDALFQGASWVGGTEVVTTSCGSSNPCEVTLVEIVISVDPDPVNPAEEPLTVRHQERLRNAS
jgi:type II secretory pathway pseudopilin PulG